MTSDQFKISDLIYRRHCGQLSPEEDRELQNWIDSSPQRKAYYEKLFTDYSLQQIDTLSKIEVNSAWQNYNQRYQRKLTRFFLLKYASVVAVVIIIGLGLYFGNRKTAPQKLTAENTTHGNAKVVLVIDNTEIPVNNSLNISLNDGTQITSNSANLSYDASGSAKNALAPEQHMLKVPRGANFFITLSDGTKVWVNSETTLKYPSHFTDNKRVVELDGEAYFDVTKNPSRPFIVRTNGVDVRVLGTEFNVNSYKESGFVVTTLVEGRVKVMLKGNKDAELTPGMQSSYNTHTAKIELHSNVNTQLYTAWRNGFFMYENNRLEDIMQQMVRWYDIKVVYENDECRDLRFTGEFEQFKDFEHIAKFLNLTSGVSVRIENNVVYIKMK